MRLSNKNFPLSLQPAPAWTAILSLIIFILFALLARVGLIAWLIYYLGSFAVGIFLYQRYPILYVGFTLWLWFVGPFIKRLIDYQSGYNTPGAWTLIPLLVTSISFVTLVRHLPRSLQQGGFPFILGCASVIYGFLIQLINQPLRLGTITIFLTWLSSYSLRLPFVHKLAKLFQLSPKHSACVSLGSDSHGNIWNLAIFCTTSMGYALARRLLSML